MKHILSILKHLVHFIQINSTIIQFFLHSLWNNAMSFLQFNFLGGDMEALSLEIEREKFEYLEKSKHLQDQLETFKSEIDDLKLDEQVTELDKFHSQQQTQGENKYSTIQKVFYIFHSGMFSGPACTEKLKKKNDVKFSGDLSFQIRNLFKRLLLHTLLKKVKIIYE